MCPVFTVGEMKQRIASVLLDNASLIAFTYSVDYFGNMVEKIRWNRAIHIFSTDRGEIFHNKKMLCDSSYHDKEDTFTKLLQMISKESVNREAWRSKLKLILFDGCAMICPV